MVHWQVEPIYQALLSFSQGRASQLLTARRFLWRRHSRNWRACSRRGSLEALEAITEHFLALELIHIAFEVVPSVIG